MRRSEGAPRRFGAGTIALVTALMLAGCTDGTPDEPEPDDSAPGEASVTAAAIEHLGAEPCPDEVFTSVGLPPAAGMLCGELEVLRDREDPDAGTVTLAVSLTEGDAPRGVLVLIGGGPGGSSTWTVPLVRAVMPDVAAEYQLMAMDLRGTGSGAIDCPEVQAEVGSSDILPASDDAVAACATVVGEWTGALEGALSTDASIADLDQLRDTLGAGPWTLDGTSYGTFVAQQYALEHPDAVRALVLDSVVPTAGVDPFLLSSFAALPDVLADACDELACTADPAEDVAAVLADGYPALPLFNTLVAMSVASPTFATLPAALASARDGDTGALDDLVAQMQAGAASPLAMFSAGTHIATLCADTPQVWDAETVDPAARAAARDAAVAALTPEQTWPFPPSVAGQLATVDACVQWPGAGPAEPTDGALPGIPVLLVTGERDLSTPFANAQAVAAELADPTVVTIPGGGHAVQLTPAGSGVVSEFLLAQ